MGISDFNCQWCISLYKPYNEIYLRSVIMLYLQCFYSTAQTLASDISISTKMNMYHYKIDTTNYLLNPFSATVTFLSFEGCLPKRHICRLTARRHICRLIDYFSY